MKYLMILISILWTSNVLAQNGDVSRVAIQTESDTTVSAGKVEYVFQLIDTKSNVAIRDLDLDIAHEKLLHMLVYDPTLEEFQHVHPVFNGQNWTVELNFTVNGEYWIWEQGVIASDGEEFSSATRLKVENGKPQGVSPPTLSDIRNGHDGSSVVELGSNKIIAGKMLMLDLKFSRNDGTSPSITPYLGAIAHIVAVPENGDSLIHVHPMAGKSSDKGMIHTTFPSQGAYRLWIQFMDGGVLRVVPLSVIVK
jgi:hypothetical protein